MARLSNMALAATAALAVMLAATPAGAGSPCPSDCSGDGAVGFDDILIVLAQWDTPGPQGDVNSDGTVNFADILQVLADWGPCD